MNKETEQFKEEIIRRLRKMQEKPEIGSWAWTQTIINDAIAEINRYEV